jgi:hypothetical protein
MLCAGFAELRKIAIELSKSLTLMVPAKPMLGMPSSSTPSSIAAHPG